MRASGKSTGGAAVLLLASLTFAAVLLLAVAAAWAAVPAVTIEKEPETIEKEPETCPNAVRRLEQHSTYLPDCRAYEMVSPPDKNGGNINGDSGRTRAAADGNAIDFASLSPFGDVTGTGIATDYMAIRSSEGPGPLGTGWVTHAITPLGEAQRVSQLSKGLETIYEGDFSEDLGAGVVATDTPQSEEPYVAEVRNLYLRTDLRTPGSYQLITACPRCVEKEAALSPALESSDELHNAPRLAGTAPGGERAIFESTQRLTGDTPGQPNVHLFEWDHGALRLAGRVPSGSATECDDTAGPACIAASTSLAGQGTYENTGFEPTKAPHTLSDGSDGHSRIFFTVPTKENGTTPEPRSYEGQLYLRLDGHQTTQINASERTDCAISAAGETPKAPPVCTGTTPKPDAASPAIFWDASANGERAFFTSKQALTDDAPPGNFQKLYMYDATKPGSDPHNLTFLSADSEPADGSEGGVEEVVGASRDGSYVYFTAEGQLVAGAPAVPPDPSGSVGIYVWHDGTLSYVGLSRGGGSERGHEMAIAGPVVSGHTGERQARVAPDGTHLLFRSQAGQGMGFDAGEGEDELYVYDAAASTATEPDLRCASCPPHDERATALAGVPVHQIVGNSHTSWHENHALSDDGRYVFFSTEQSLVPEDTNGVSDAYEYDTATEEVHLLSSGTSSDGSWFLDASRDGSNAFILTAQPLVGWDVDGADDVYDVRVDGGFPEPTPRSAPCGSAETCKAALAAAPGLASLGSMIEGPGNSAPERGHSCPRGKRQARLHGKARCVKTRQKHKHKKKRRHARTGRKGSK